MKIRLLVLLLPLLFLLADAWAQAPALRPEKWAQRVETEGVSNLHRIAPGIFRSGQPSAEGFRAVERLGIRKVISLRDDFADEKVANGAKFRFVRIPMELGTPSEDALLRAVAELAAPNEGPVLVHCLLGADRTGAVCALYRVLVQDWPREEALRELREGGFGFGLEEFSRYLTDADLPRLRKAFAQRVKAQSAVKPVTEPR